MSLFQPDFEAEGPGVPKDEPKKPGITRFFILWRRKFWNIVFANLCYILFSIPAFVINWFIGFYLICFLFQGEAEIPAGAWLTLLSFALSLSVFLGSGPATMGMNYVLRNYVREKNSWVWSDFREKFKEHFKQGMAVYFVNLFVFAICMFGILFYSYNGASFIFAVGKWVLTLFLVIGAMMQPFINMMVVSFDMPLHKIYKNAFLLLLIKLPQNIAVYLVGALVAVGIGMLSSAYAFSSFGAVVLVLIFLFQFSLPHFIWDINAFSVTEKYMIREEESTTEPEEI